MSVHIDPQGNVAVLLPAGTYVRQVTVYVDGDLVIKARPAKTECELCGGSGLIPRGDEKPPGVCCPDCDGTGKKPLTQVLWDARLAP